VLELPEDLVVPLLPESAPAPPAAPRDAATVMLLRDTAAGPEVFLLRRVGAMAFAAGMTVFPGGGVDRRDADAAVAWTGPEPEWWAQRFGTDVGLARALVCAAVRETFEESGVLLAGPDPDTVVADTSPFAQARQDLVDRNVSLAGFLAQNSLVLRADLLRPWANWLTPAGEPRRYNTRFFLAELPAGQRADGVTTEADASGWQRPAEALADREAGRAALMPPTWVTLRELAEFTDVAAATAAEREITLIEPKLVRTAADTGRVVLPGDPEYDRTGT
jgi:8-oxo-dGTP pyrophosphatase MutT (NUDIX family)